MDGVTGPMLILKHHLVQGAEKGLDRHHVEETEADLQSPLYLRNTTGIRRITRPIITKYMLIKRKSV